MKLRAGVLVSLVWPSVGWAQTGDPAKATPADTLTSQALSEMKNKDYQRACPRLAEVTSLVPDSYGAWLNLGSCYWGLDRMASAWITYKHAVEVSPSARERAEATRWVRKLEPRLSRITVLVPESIRRLAELRVYRDGIPVGPGQWGVSIPVDKGSHPIVAMAKGKGRWETTVAVEAEGTTQAVMIDGPREDDPQALLPPPPSSFRMDAGGHGGPSIVVDAGVHAGASIRVGSTPSGTEGTGLAFGASAVVAPFRWFGVGLMYEHASFGGVPLSTTFPGLDLGTTRNFDTLWAGLRLRAPEIGRVRFSAVFAPGMSWQSASLLFRTNQRLNDAYTPTPFVCSASDGPRFALRAGVGADVMLAQGFSLMIDTSADNMRFSTAASGACAVRVGGAGELIFVGVHTGFAYRFGR